MGIFKKNYGGVLKEVNGEFGVIANRARRQWGSGMAIDDSGKIRENSGPAEAVGFGIREQDIDLVPTN